MESPDSLQTRIEQQLRIMRAIWGALLMSIVGYYVLTILIGQPQGVEENSAISLAFIAIALSTLAISIPIKKKIVAQAVEQQRVELVQQAYIIAWAITEVGALMGLVDFFITGHAHYYIPMIIAALGILLHFPNRQHIIDASFKNPTL